MPDIESQGKLLGYRAIQQHLASQTRRASHIPRDLAVDRFMRDSLTELVRATSLYGERSRAAYLVKYVVAGQALSLWSGSPHLEKDSQIRLKTLVDVAVEDLAEHFEVGIAWEQRPAPFSSEVVVERGSRRTRLYEYDRSEYTTRLAGGQDGVNPLLLDVNSSTVHSVRGNAPYMYCVLADGEERFRLLNRPLSALDMIDGVRVRDALVKHPHLAAPGLRVLCAGDVWIAKAPDGSVSGLLISRASGQYRPSVEAMREAAEIARRIVGLDRDRIRLIAHPGIGGHNA